MEDGRKPHLPLGRILEMNAGFLGLQFSFGLQQSNMGPIYSYLGAGEAMLPLLFLAGPVTGLVVQPLIGALSDRTSSRLGRRTPYFLAGAVVCSLGLAAMPFSRTLLMAACLLWLLDGASNVTLEPYRAYVSDRLDADQRALGFLTQSAFTGLAQTLAYLTPSLLVLAGVSRDALDGNGVPAATRIAFQIGAVVSIASILWSVVRVRELPLSTAEIAAMRRRPAALATTFADLRDAVREMPQAMRDMAWMSLFQWYAIAAYWAYVVYAVARNMSGAVDAHTAGFREAVLLNGQLGALFNFVAFVAAFAMTPLARRFGPKVVHAVSLACAGGAMLMVAVAHQRLWLFLPAVGLGLGWASMMGNPYILLADSIPAKRTGIYMGIFNMFIVVPMLVTAATLPLLYSRVLAGDPRHVVQLSGVLMLFGAAATLRIRATPVPRPALT